MRGRCPRGSGHVRRGVDGGGEVVQRGLFEHHPSGQPKARVAGAGGQLHGEDAVPAEAEEVVVSPGDLDVEHVGEQGGQRPFGVGRRWFRGVTGRPHRRFGGEALRADQFEDAVGAPAGLITRTVQPPTGIRTVGWATNRVAVSAASPQCAAASGPPAV